MAPLRLSSLLRLGGLTFLALFVLHFLASFSTSPPPSSPYYDPRPHLGTSDQDTGWGERFGLDHYAHFEEGLKGSLGSGFGKLAEGVSKIGGGLGIGGRTTKLGSLHELIGTSNPSPRPAYYDARTSIDRLKLTSTRVLGHGQSSTGSASTDDGEDAFAPRQRRHILVTGGFGSIGKHVVRDLLLNSRSTSKDDSWSGGPGSASLDELSWERDAIITILDSTDRTSELNFLLQSAPLDKPGRQKLKGTDPRTQAFSASERSVESFKRMGKLRVVVGDVRDANLVKELLSPQGNTVTELSAEQQAAALLNAKLGPLKQKGHQTKTTVIPPVTGIIHLASYSPPACRLNPVDCADVEKEGMKTILAGLEREGLEKLEGKKGEQAVVADRPWIVMPRRGDQWDEAASSINSNATAPSILASEALIKTFTETHPLHSLLLQLPSYNSIIGDPYAPRFDIVPNIVQSALAHLPVSIYPTTSQNEPFLAIDDASTSIIQSARMLDVAFGKEYLRPLGFVAEVGVVGPPLASTKYTPLGDLAHTALALTLSQSPFSEIFVERTVAATASNPQFHNSEAALRKTASKVLGFTPTTSTETTLKSYISSILKLHSSHLSSKINVACSSPPSIPVLEEGVLALAGCNTQLLTLIEGAYYTLGCSQGLEGPHQEPLAIVSAVPYKEGVRGVEIFAERGLEGKVDIQMRCPVVGKDGKLVPGKSEIVMWADTPEGGEFAEASKPGAHPIAEWYTVEFAQRDARSFTLTLPPTEGVPEGQEPKRRLTLKDPNSPKRQMLFQPIGDDARALLWKFNPICCAAEERRKDVWDFFKEDPLLTSQVTYPSEDGRTTLAASTLATKRCGDLRAEHDQIVKLEKNLKAPSGKICHSTYGDVNAWSPKDLPTCAVDCSAPLPCVASEACKCTRDRCGDSRAKGPFPSVAFTEQTSFPTPEKKPQLSLTDRVNSITWDSLILPSAKDAFRLKLDALPNAHVIELPQTIDNHLKKAACYDLEKSPLPFMGDHFLVEALRNRSVALDKAEFVMIPYYQGCTFNYLQENTFKKLAETVSYAERSIAASSKISAEQIVVPFTHDFGSCTGWWPKLGDVLGHSPPSPMNQAVAWQVNGDYNTRCIKPDRDIVIPAVTKHTKALFETFAEPVDIAPANTRKHLAFFAGGVRGFGAIARTKIGCGRTGQDAESQILYQQFSPGQRYLGTLNSAKFCLLPRGIPAWTTRTFEAIYAGCIPAFIVDRNLFPFQDILDYSRFSITIPENEAHRVEEILSVYTPEQLDDLQANLVRVRDAFLFKHGEEWERKGPLFFSLVSMAMRLPLQYPQVGSCVS
ncbi:hypothetical protein JCM16303_002422 [Sporobolomyces ruberrimus]